MKKLLICCLFGNTANSLAKKMQSLAEREGYPLMISAVGLDNFASVAPAFDGFLIAPHIQYKLDEIKERLRTSFHLYELENMMNTKNTFLSKDYDRLISQFTAIKEEKVAFLEERKARHNKIISQIETLVKEVI